MAYPQQKYSDKQIREAFIRTGGNISQTARDLGCSPVTLYYRIGKDEDLAELLKKCRGGQVLRSVNMLTNLMEDDEDPKLAFQAAKYYLNTIGKDYGFGDRPPPQRGRDDKVKEFLGLE